jgi:curved DNA-binding protein CbpA
MQLSSELSSDDRFRTHYDVLGVSTTADANTIRSAFYNLARQIHPDKRRSSSVVAADDITMVQNAYSVLNDERQRREYDLALKIRCLQNQHQEASATQIQRCDCREVIVTQSDDEGNEDEVVELVFTCRCGNMIETSFADEKTNLIACSMCSLQYDTVLLWKEGENDEIN